MPVVIGAKGVERIVEIELTGAERGMFDKSADAVAGSGRCLQEDRARSGAELYGRERPASPLFRRRLAMRVRNCAVRHASPHR